MPDLLQRSVSVQSPTGQKVTGEVIHYDGLLHTGGSAATLRCCAGRDWHRVSLRVCPREWRPSVQRQPASAHCLLLNCIHCQLLIVPAVRLPDGSTQHFNLRQQPYKVTQDQPSTRDGGIRPSRRGSEPPGSQGPSAQQQQEPGSGPGPSNGKRLKVQTSPNSNSTGGSGSVRAAAVGAAAAAGRERKQPGAAAADTRADGTSKPPRRAAADRAAAVAVAVSMGGNGGMHHGRDADAGGEKSSRRPAPTPKAGAAGGAFSGGGSGTKRPADVGWDAGRKLPPLNMSHVSKKDREAARMLLTFSSPTGQEVRQPGRQGGAAADVASPGGDRLHASASPLLFSWLSLPDSTSRSTSCAQESVTHHDHAVLGLLCCSMCAGAGRRAAVQRELQDRLRPAGWRQQPHHYCCYGAGSCSGSRPARPCSSRGGGAAPVTCTDR